jgi:predicted transcriptional regulator
METIIDNDLLHKFTVVAKGQNSDLVRRFIEILDQQEEEYFSPEDIAEIQAGIAEIERGETVPWKTLKQELNL